MEAKQARLIQLFFALLREYAFYLTRPFDEQVVTSINAVPNSTTSFVIAINTATQQIEATKGVEQVLCFSNEISITEFLQLIPIQSLTAFIIQIGILLELKNTLPVNAYRLNLPLSNRINRNKYLLYEMKLYPKRLDRQHKIVSFFAKFKKVGLFSNTLIQPILPFFVNEHLTILNSWKKASILLLQTILENIYLDTIDRRFLKLLTRGYPNDKILYFLEKDKSWFQNKEKLILSKSQQLLPCNFTNIQDLSTVFTELGFNFEQPYLDIQNYRILKILHNFLGNNF